ncbi:MAG: hypothetical protein WCQ76_06000 [Fusobacterium sp.]
MGEGVNIIATSEIVKAFFTIILMGIIGVSLGYIAGLYCLIEVLVKNKSNNSKLFKNKKQIYKKYITKFSSFRYYMCETSVLVDKINKDIREYIPRIKFQDGMKMVSFTLKRLEQNNSILVVSNSYQIGEIFSHKLRVLGKRKGITLIHTTIERSRQATQGIDYDYILWIDVVRQEYVLYKKDEYGRNVIREFI